MAGYLRVHAESRNGLCVLRLTGELDLTTAEDFAERADSAVEATPGPVAVDLSGLTFIDARGARALAAVIHTLPGKRRAVVRSCPPHIRLVLDILGLSLNSLPADYLPARNWATSPSATRDLVDRVQRARLHASEATLETSRALDRLASTAIRLANTTERAGLIRDQGQRTLARSKAVREQLALSRQKAAT